jgi:hypothetical protein
MVIRQGISYSMPLFLAILLAQNGDLSISSD